MSPTFIELVTKYLICTICESFVVAQVDIFLNPTDNIEIKSGLNTITSYLNVGVKLESNTLMQFNRFLHWCWKRANLVSFLPESLCIPLMFSNPHCEARQTIQTIKNSFSISCSFTVSVKEASVTNYLTCRDWLYQVGTTDLVQQSVCQAKTLSDRDMV